MKKIIGSNRKSKNDAEKEDNLESIKTDIESFLK